MASGPAFGSCLATAEEPGGSSGSACSNGAPSHVLQAIGRSRAEAEASLRLSLGRETTAAEVDQAIAAITDAAVAAGFLSGR